MSLAKTQTVVNNLRARGITVHEWTGWQGRGNGQTSDYRGGIVHHTGSAYGSAYQALVSGRPDLAGPLCNFAGNDDGTITVIAAGPANHAGASGGYAMGPLPVSSSFNKYVMGLEIVYPGTSPMRPAQYHAATVWARVVADVCGGGNIQCIRAHAETSVTGKWDPGDAPSHTIDMNAFRAAAVNPAEESDMPLSVEDINNFVYAMKYRVIKSPDFREFGDNRHPGDCLLESARSSVAAAQGIASANVKLDAMTAVLAAIHNDPDITVDVLRQIVDDVTPNAADIAAEIRPGLVADMLAQLGPIVTEAAGEEIATVVVRKLGEALVGSQEGTNLHE